MYTRVNGVHLFATIAFALIGVFCVVGGILLFASHLAVAGYGIWIYVWGLAFLIGALSRYPVRTA